MLQDIFVIIVFKLLLEFVQHPFASVSSTLVPINFALLVEADRQL